MKDDSLFIVCSCSSLDHVIWFHQTYDIYNHGECYVHVAIDTQQSLWRRIKTAWELLWNRSPCRYIASSEIVVEVDDLKNIRDWCDRSIASLETSNK